MFIYKNIDETSCERVNILLVDDHPENLLALEAVLSSCNYNLVMAHSGEEALKWVLKEDFAVILLDVQMPRLNGFETAKLIRQREKSRHIPIIFITAISQVVEHVLHGYNLGAIDYIFKPFNAQTLRLKIEGFVRLHENLRKEIKERKLIMEKLKSSNNQIKAILASITDAFFAVDENWVLIYVNSEAEKQLGKSGSELLGKNLWEVYSQYPEHFLKQLFLAVARQEPVHFEIIYKDKTQEVHAYPSENGLSVYMKDITQRKKMEQDIARLDRLNVIGEMAAGISHEVRNPMTTVRGFLQMLASKEDCVRYQEYFNLMIEELDRANSIISEFLSISKSKPEELQMHNLNDIIKAIYPLLQASAMASNKYIELYLGNVIPIKLNEKEIRQVILNLAKNGLDAMPEGLGLIIRTYTEEQDVVLAVEDKGSGISPEFLDKLGTPFFTTKAEGTGLGLATCYGIAARHGAHILVETGTKGTIFQVRFNIAKPKDGTP